MFQDIKKQITFFLKNKWYVISIIFAAIAGYGYEITHTSMGIDDVCINIYFDDGLGVAIGRWPFYLINKVFHVTGFQPFMVELMAVCILCFASILWAGVLRYIIGDKLPVICYIAFSAMFLDYPLIAEVFIFYLQNGIAFIYAFIAIAIFDFYYIQTHKIEKKQRIIHILCSSIIVSAAIGFYESAANVYLFAVILMMLIDCIGEKRLNPSTLKNLFFTLFLMARILVYAIVERTLITRLCRAVFDIESYGYRSVQNALWIFRYPGRIQTIVRQIIRDYYVAGTKFYPITLFVLASLFFGVLVLAYTIYKKNGYIFLLGIGLYLSLFILSIPQGEVLPYRTNQMLSLFVAFALFEFCVIVQKCRYRLIRVLGMILAVSFIYNAAFDLNGWFAFEYQKNQAELAVIDNIAYELQKGYDIDNKPVVFIGEYQLGSATLDKCSIHSGDAGYQTIKSLNDWMEIETGEQYVYTQTLSESVVDWAIWGFSRYEGYNREMIRLFAARGCQLLWGGNELYEKALEREEELNRYPVNGYIKEYEDYIVVRF